MQKSPHILIVEDDAYISELIALYLDKHGYTYSIAEDGAAAVELLDVMPLISCCSILCFRSWTAGRYAKKSALKEIFRLLWSPGTGRAMTS